MYCFQSTLCQWLETDQEHGISLMGCMNCKSNTGSNDFSTLYLPPVQLHLDYSFTMLQYLFLSCFQKNIDREDGSLQSGICSYDNLFFGRSCSHRSQDEMQWIELPSLSVGSPQTLSFRILLSLLRPKKYVLNHCGSLSIRNTQQKYLWQISFALYFNILSTLKSIVEDFLRVFPHPLC